MSALAIKILIAILGIGAVIGAYEAWVHHERDIGRDEIRAEWGAAREKQTAQALAESRAKARESVRRLDQQQENQRVQDAEIAALRAAVDRNAADADRVRNQSTAAARDWAARLADSPTRGDLEAAGAAIAVLTDVRGRLDSAAGQLAAYAGAARTAGLKCERDYDSLTPVKP